MQAPTWYALSGGRSGSSLCAVRMSAPALSLLTSRKNTPPSVLEPVPSAREVSLALADAAECESTNLSDSAIPQCHLSTPQAKKSK